MFSIRTHRLGASVAPDRARRGFTLIELIVAMTLLSVVCMAVLGMVTSQSRYVGQINTDVQMLDQVRAANELLGTEIADLPRGAVLFARRDSIQYRLPIMWGVICGPVDRQAVQAKKTKLKKGETPIAPTTKIALEFEPPAEVLGNPSPEGLGISENGTTFTYKAVSSWSWLALVSSDSAGRSCLDGPALAGKKKKAAKPKKNALPLPPPITVIESLEDYYETVQIGTLFNDAPDERALILGYVTVSYFLKPLVAGEYALYRSTSTGTQKLAWPFSAGAGFTYRLDDNSVSTTIALADIPRIRAIRVDLPATRKARNNARADSVLVQPWIPLFNAR
jgi:prepilin-type N-terminal cleavage/methylation domain-containing protein